MRKLEKKKVDEIGRVVVKAATLPNREIERIVGNEMLFESIRKRIALETSDRKAHSWMRPGVKALAACAVLIAIVSAFYVLRPSPVEVVVDRVVAPPEVSPAQRFAEPDKIVDTADLPEPVLIDRAERVSTRTTTKVSRPKMPSTTRQGANTSEFYALSYAGDPNETERGGRIVRVDLPRTVLFAMGVDIPLENEVETVKAELLVGSDGVTRAIRVIR